MNHILITNDDGLGAPGLMQLASALRAQGYRVTVVAPDRNCSGQSHALTLRMPIAVTWHDAQTVGVQGTPVDCVYLAMNGLLPQVPDLVISGINAGENLGDDVIYSGTLAAAVEAHLAGLPAMAVSLAGQQHFAPAAEVACQGITWLTQLDSVLLNINIPDRPLSKMMGVLVTQQGKRNISARGPLEAVDIRGQSSYWVAKPTEPLPECLDKRFDFGAIANGYVSVTPLTLDRTDHQQLATVRHHLEDVALLCTA